MGLGLSVHILIQADGSGFRMLRVHESSGLWWSVGDEVTGYSNLYKKITYVGIRVKRIIRDHNWVHAPRI